MGDYIVTDRDGRAVRPGDTVTSCRGTSAVFVRVTRGPEHNGTAKVAVTEDGDSREYYARVFGLTVTPTE